MFDILLPPPYPSGGSWAALYCVYEFIRSSSSNDRFFFLSFFNGGKREKNVRLSMGLMTPGLKSVVKSFDYFEGRGKRSFVNLFFIFFSCRF